MFGQQTQGNQGGFGQQANLAGAGLFGGVGQGQLPQAQQQQSSFGQFGAGSGQPKQGGLFGNVTPSSFGGAQQTSGLFGQQNSAPQASTFGNSGVGQAAQTKSSFFGGASGGTGGFGQPQTQPGGLFGGTSQPVSNFAASGFQNTSQFGGVQQQQPAQSAFGQMGGGLFPQSQAPAQSGFATSSFGSNGLFGQQQQQQNIGTGIFGQPNTFGAIQGQQLGDFVPIGGQAKAQLYQDLQKYPAQITTIGSMFTPIKMNVADNVKSTAAMTMNFHSIRANDQLVMTSIQMLRMMDYIKMKGAQTQNYEFIAMNEYKQNPQKYKQELLDRFGSQNSADGQKQGFPLGVQTSQWGQASSGLQAASQQKWGTQGQQSPIFGQQSQAAPTGGLFNQAASTGGMFQSNSTFGQQPATQGFNGFQQQAQPQASSMFGGQSQQMGIQQPQQTAGGLFGNPAGTPGGLFGNQMQPQPQQAQPTMGGALFVNKTQGGGLFGQQPGTPVGNQLAGVNFNQQPTQQTATPLFAQQTTQQPSQGGLFQNKPAGGSFQTFGQTQQPLQQQQQSTLFQSQPLKPTTSLFGNTATAPSMLNFQQTALQPTMGGGLFGGLQPAQSSMFGNLQQQPNQNSLFSSQQPAQSSLLSGAQPQPGLFQQPSQNSLNNPQPGGMFQTTFQQPQQQQPNQLANVHQIYQSLDPFNINSGFMSKANPIENFQKEIELIRKQSEAAPNPYSNEPQQAFDSNQAYRQVAPISMNLYLDYGPLSQAYEIEQERQRAKQESKLNFQRQQASRNNESYHSSQSSQSQGYRDLRSLTFSRNSSELMTSQNSYEQRESFRKPDLSIGQSRLESQAFVPEPNQERGLDIITITIAFKHESQNDEEYPEFTQSIAIHKLRDVQDIWNRTAQWLTKEFKFQEKRGQKFKLLYKGKEVDRFASLQDAEITQDVKLFVVIQDESKAEANKKTPQLDKPVEDSKKMKDLNSLAPVNMVPKAPKQGYKIEPDIPQMSRMTLDELQHIEGLKIQNEFGSVEFIGQADVTQVDFADVVTILKGSVEVYDEVRHRDNYPQVGQKLNRSAIITLNEIKPRNEQSGVQKETLLRKNITQAGGEHISYDLEKFIWTFKVQHFTKYGNDDDNQSQEASKDSVKGKMETSHSADEAAENDMEIDENISIQSEKQQLFETHKAPSLVPKDQKSFQSIEVQPVQPQKQRKVIDIFADQQEKMITIPKNEAMILGSMKKEADIALLKRIAKREELFKKCNPVTTSKPSNMETILQIKSLVGSKLKLANTSLKQGGQPRPCFNPNGSVGFFKNNKEFNLVSTPAVEKNNNFSILNIVLKHCTFQQDDGLKNQFERMGLQNFNQSDNLSRLKDIFFRELLNGKIPSCKMFSNFQSRGISLAIFLYDLAKELAIAGDDKTLRHEFYVVCMLNALFGNPASLLHQLHNDYKGPKTLEKTKLLFQSQIEILEKESPLIIEKMRRNCLSELLKFICQSEFPARECPQNASDDQIYARVFDLIVNGDIKNAVQFLQQKQKTKVAMIISQSVNATQNMALLKQYKQSMQGGKTNKCLLQVLDLITGSIFSSIQNWEQILLCQLNFSRPATEELTKVLQQNPIFNNQTNIYLTLLKVYANIKCQDELDNFGFSLTPASNSRSYRLKWIVMLVLMHQQMFKQDNYVSIPNFNETTAKFAYQLLGQADWKTALTVAMVMYPSQNASRRTLLFQIITSQAQRLISTQRENANRQFVIQRIGIPEHWVFCSLALMYQLKGLFEMAIDQWVQATNFNQAHSILYKSILPLYIHKSSGVQVVKALTQKTLSQETKKRLFSENEICKIKPNLYQLLILFETKKELIVGWSTQGAVFKRFVTLLQTLGEKTISDDATWQQRNIREITEIKHLINSNNLCLSSSKPLPSTIVPYFISLQLQEIQVYLEIELVEQLTLAKARKSSQSHEFDASVMIQSSSDRPEQNKAQAIRNIELMAVNMINSTQRLV